jgi:AraC family transcriptional regulator of adaptative response/methylated-DNA-[protein]-cysteine methyltransferase
MRTYHDRKGERLGLFSFTRDAQAMTTTAGQTARTKSKTFATDAARWQAIARRDPAADGCFVYSVRTTGVYCRPTCPARRALRRNVRFHRTAGEAEAHGYRPCKRCRPSDASGASHHVQMVTQACRRIEQADQPTGLDQLAREAGMSRFHFHRVFKKQTGLTPKAYAGACRARRVRQELTERTTVTGALHQSGYGSSGRFYAAAQGALGMTPGRYRAGGHGETIRFAIGQCWLGAILVAATDQGVCAVSLGDDPDSLARELQDRFHQAQLVGDDRQFQELVARVVGFVEAPETGLDLPLDIRGTAFQERVWQALRAIPPGRTATYTEIAESIGQPNSARAVARACAANTLAVAIPCHRVIRRDGSLSGYHWGVERKEKLLKRERQFG